MRDDIDFNVQFCEIVEQYPALYDYTKSEYSNKNVQDKIWREIGLKVSATAKECKDRWKNIRCSYSKNKKSMNAPSGSATKPIKEYYLAPHLRFLDNFIKSRPSKSNININTDRIDSDEDESTTTSAGSYTGELQETDFITPQTTQSLPKKTQINLGDVNKSAYDYFSNKNKQIKTKEQNVDDSDADMAFFRSMLPDVKIMTQNQKRKLKMGVLNLIEQILKEPIASPISYSRSSFRTESPYQRTPSPAYNSSAHMRSRGSPIPQQTQTTGAYEGSATQPTQPALQQIQTTAAYEGSATQKTQPALQQTQSVLQQTQTTDVYRSPTHVYLPMFSPVTPVIPQSHQTYETLHQPHDNNLTDFNNY